MFEKLSAERKQLQIDGEVPSYYTTQGYIMFKRKYAYKGETVKGAFTRISKHLAQYDPREEAEERFFNLLWSGKFAPSTPVMCNTGTNRGMPVSCAGNYVGDTIEDFYECNAEIAVLSKNGFGTASYLGDVRHRGAIIGSSGGEADGIVPLFDTYCDTKTKISQGSSRRGEWAGYVNISHPDFWEMIGYIQKNPASANIGWVYELKDYEALKSGDEEAVRRWNEVLYMRCRTGKGYMWKNWIANKDAPAPIKNSGIRIRSSQLCTEISLPADEDHTFTCILSSLNLTYWDEMTDDDIKWSIRLLDAVCSDFLKLATGKKFMEKAVRFTEKARAIGLGTLGYHSYLQQNMVAFESGEAHMINNQIYSRLRKVAQEASIELGAELGVPLWCQGAGEQRNATLLTIAPNMSSALLAGGVSQGVEPIICNAFIQQSNSGDFIRTNPTFVKLAVSKGMYSQELLDDLAINHYGSVQHLTWLTPEEKMVFRTAYEIDQLAIIRKASARQRHLDQTQSINLFFSADEKEEVIAKVHHAFIEDERMISLYYLRSERGVAASNGESTCQACEG